MRSNKKYINSKQEHVSKPLRGSDRSLSKVVLDKIESTDVPERLYDESDVIAVQFIRKVNLVYRPTSKSKVLLLVTQMK